jgi:hypothetical protein
MAFLIYHRSPSSARMEDFDLSRCTLVLKVIDAFLDGRRGLRKTLGELKGLIILLKEGQPALSQVLSQNWSLLHEFDAYMIYRRLPGPSPWQKALIDLILKEMNSHILEAVGSRPNLTKPASDSIFQHVSVGKKQHSNTRDR